MGPRVMDRLTLWSRVTQRHAGSDDDPSVPDALRWDDETEGADECLRNRRIGCSATSEDHSEH